MSTIHIKVYEGCPVPTILWNTVTLAGFVGGIFGFMGLFYVFFPTGETNTAFVTKCAVIGIPVLILALIARVFIDRWGKKQAAGK